MFNKKMRKLIIIILVCILAVVSGKFLYNRFLGLPLESSQNQQGSSGKPQEISNASVTTVIAENLDTPWGIAFLPDGNMLVTERPGTVKHVNTKQKTVTDVTQLRQVKEIGEGGLLGIALHPDFEKNNFVYFYYTYDAQGSNTRNRVVRMSYANNSLAQEKIIVDRIPGASNHNGGRIKFGPDRNLYITTGDAQEPSLAQERNSLAGKILRVTDEGQKVPGNPFNNQIFSYGHRNPQGITWDDKGNLWQTEHGRSLPTGFDEINLIESGKNYGWPVIQGDESQSGMTTPVRHSGPTTVWAPGSAAIAKTSLFFGGLRGQALFEGVIDNGKITEVKEHFKGEFGRIREVVVGPDGMIYITTSNRDGRGNPAREDDRIVRIDPNKL
jgi:glucose/arabinose dehydrogenase